MAFFLLVAGLTGSIMAFDRELLQLQHPQHPQQTLLYRRHFLGGQGCQRAFAEADAIQCSGLVASLSESALDFLKKARNTYYKQ